MDPIPTDRWKAPNAVMGLAIAMVLIVFAACGTLLSYAATSVDRITEARETRLMTRALDRRLVRMNEDVTSASIWTDAYEAVARRYDPKWTQVNFGAYFHDYLHHDLTVVFDAQDRPIYAALAGKGAPTAQVDDFVRAARPLLAATRARAAAKIARHPGGLGFDRHGAMEAAIRVGGRVYLVSASTVVPEPEYTKPPLETPDPVVMSAAEMNSGFLHTLAEDYGLRAVRLSPSTAAADDALSVPVRGVDGAALAAVAWTPERLGGGVLLRVRWQILAFGLAVLGVVTLLLRRLRRLAQEVLEARDRAEAGDRAKSDFIANMSHEIRTPLNGVLGMAQIMEAHDLSPDQRERLKVVRDSGGALLALLNDVLDLAKIQAGKLELVDGPFTAEALGEGVCATFRGLAAAKGLALNLEVDPQVAGRVWIGDVIRIRQVLSNLIANGVKFTDAGSVTLAVAPAPGGLRFTVSDTGIGLDAAQIPKLFAKFHQADPSMTRRYGGTGLGLSICRTLVGLMGGDIAVQSRVGEGSSFTVTLPLRPRAEEAPPPLAEAAEAPAPCGSLRALAAEDNPTNQMILRALLEPLAVDLVMAADGREVVDAFSRQRFDVILMDVQMPRMDGIEATRAIRRLEAERGQPRTPILALSANVMRHQVEAYLDAGMDGHVAKPLDAADLYAALEAVVAPPARDVRAA